MPTTHGSNATLIDELLRVLPAGRVHATPEDLAVFGYDGTWATGRPDVVVSPVSTEEVQAVVKVAGKLHLPVIPRGGGTGLAGGSVPLSGGIVVNTTMMNRIIELDRLNMVAVVQCGVVNAHLQAEAQKLGLFYPPDPQSLYQSTIGGNVATGAGGPRCLKYGTTRDYVLGLQVVLADGRAIRTGGKMLKIQSGSNLTQLFVGSEGTLGIITEVTLRLIPAPRHRGTVMAVFDRLDDAAETVNRILQAGIIPLAMEMMDNLCIRAVEAFKPFGLPVDAETVLLIDQDGNHPQVVQDELSEIAALCREGGAREVRRATTPEERNELWAARRAVSPAISRLRPNKLGEDISVPRAHIPAMVRRVTEIARRHALLIPLFGHIGDGNLHPNILCDLRDRDEMERVQKAARDIFDAALALGGALSGEHGIGLLKREFLPEGLDPTVIELMRRIKWALDPHNLLNPGKVLPQAPQAPRPPQPPQTQS